MKKTRVLFVCVHNSARSQIAEAFFNRYAPEKFEALSAGLEAGTLNPFVVEAMREVGIDISKNKTKDVFDFFKQGQLFSYVISVCDKTAAERCPIFPGATIRLHWPFDDPGKFFGPKEEVLRRTRSVRDAIETKVKAFIEVINNGQGFDTKDQF